MTLAEHFNPRANALTAMRLGLAALVVLGHAYEVGGFGHDPLQAATGVTLGELGVNSFFAISGFLVTRSWIRSKSPRVYLLNRSLRIFPGLWACLLVTGFGLFPWLAHRLHGWPWPADVFNPDFARYVWHNCLLKVRQASVAGLFMDHPAVGVANGSLWSLLPEFLCYLGVAALGLIGALRAGRWRVALLAAAAIYLAQAAAPLLWPGLHAGRYGAGWWLWRLATQAAFFGGGALLALQAARVPVRPWLLGAAVAALALGAGGGIYSWVAPLALPYALLVLAGWLPGAKLDAVGDYSYGLYVYHYPAQQTLFALGWMGGGAAGYFGLTLLFALPVAALSWHFVERPALRWKPSSR